MLFPIVNDRKLIVQARKGKHDMLITLIHAIYEFALSQDM